LKTCTTAWCIAGVAVDLHLPLSQVQQQQHHPRQMTASMTISKSAAKGQQRLCMAYGHTAGDVHGSSPKMCMKVSTADVVNTLLKAQNSTGLQQTCMQS